MSGAGNIAVGGTSIREDMMAIKHIADRPDTTWARPPQPLMARVLSMPARHRFLEHHHSWHQIIYAVSGVLTISVTDRSFIISPEQAMWMPAGFKHHAGTLCGAEFRSLWIESSFDENLPDKPQLFEVSAFLKALIIESSSLKQRSENEDYVYHITYLIAGQLKRARPLESYLVWPKQGALASLCESLYDISRRFTQFKRVGKGAWGFPSGHCRAGSKKKSE